jgi:thiol-disulfide isomerase/thioredoxin
MSKSTRSKSLHITSKENTKELDEVLSNGLTTTVVIVVSWCGACKRVKPMWLNALKKKNKKNLVLIDNEVLPETSLNSLNVNYFPSTFEIPSGGKPNLVENPQTMQEINAILNGSAPTRKSTEASGSQESEEVNASEYVTIQHTPRNNGTPMPENTPTPDAETMRTRSFTPSLEKLKGGRRRNKTKSKSKRSKRTRRR